MVKELSYRERAPARTVAFVPLTEADGAQKAVARLMGLLADEEGVSVLESPQHVHSELDYFAAITRGERGFGLHFDCMRLGKRGSLLILGLTELPTGPPGVGRCPPLVDDRGARAMLAIVDGCLGAMFSGDLVRWCAPGEQRALLDAYLVGAPAG